jgi:hypothetical protein
MARQEFRGVIQVQGKDMREQKSWPWARNTPVSAAEGIERLAELEARCTKDELKQRAGAFRRARRFIAQAAAQGGVTPEAQPASFQDPKRTIPDARVDIEIRAGRAFLP